MQIPFAFQSYRHASLPLSAQRCVNMYAEAQPQGAKAQMPILGCPGIDARVTLGSGPLRGAHVMSDTLYVVSGGTLYQVDEDGTTTPLGGVVSGTGPVSMADNATELVIVNGTNGYIWSSAAGFRLISDADFNAADTVTFIDGFFLFNNSGTGEFFRSDLLDGTSYDSTAFATAESQSDDLLAVRNHKQVLYLLGQRSIELWSNVGAANFPFQRIPGALIDRGLASSYAITDEDESLFILGDDRIAYRLDGRSIKRISTHAIEIEWQNYSSISDAILFSYTWNGHKFICYTFPEVASTWEFDVATNLWHERKSHDRLGNDLGRWRANIAIDAYSRIYIGDAFSGKLGTLSNTTYTEFGEDTRAIAVSPPNHDPNGKRLFMPWFELDIETGVGLTSGQGSDPQAMLSISDNGGRSFDPPEVWVSMGKIGEYDGTAYQLRWDRLGNFFNRCMMIEISDPVRRAIYGARAPELSVGI